MSEEYIPVNFPQEFKTFSKIPRLSREMIITEKIDGTNSQVCITESGDIFAGSRNRWLTPTTDNYGFCKWVIGNKEDLMKLGPGIHFGEWWGLGIQRNYGLKEKRWSLFNVKRWCLATEEPKLIPNPDPKLQKYQERLPACCSLVPVIADNREFDTLQCEGLLQLLNCHGSYAAPSFMNPEGIVICHKASGYLFKKTIENDSEPKGRVKKE